MKLEVTEPNYCATIIRIHVLNKLDGLDRLVAVPSFGFQALTSSAEVGQLMVLFTAETQLSAEFASINNLFRHSNLNLDPVKTGYLEDNARIRAVRFRGHTSNALLMPLTSLSYLGIDTNELKEGDTFNSINGKEICKKYRIKFPQTQEMKNKVRGVTKRFERIDNKLMPEHLDSDNWWKNEHKIGDYEYCIVTQKIHGTSVRLTNQVVARQLNWKERVLKWFGFKIQETEYDYVAGSRRVIKDNKSSTQFQHYYSEDIYNEALKNISYAIPKGFVVYGELVGWVGSSPIQKNYTYQIPVGNFELYIYRVSFVNPDGFQVDLTWKQLKEFCNNNGLKHVPEIWKGEKRYFNVDQFMNKKYHEQGMTQCLPLDKESPCDEGVIIRVDAIKPYLLKAKSPMFFEHETKQLDAGVVDLESQQDVKE